MKSVARLAALLGVWCATSFDQQIPDDQAIAFDVASVKVSSGEGSQPGGGRKGAPPFAVGPTRLAARHLTLRDLIARAYEVDESEVAGGPTWINSDRYEIDARVEKPAGRERMLGMLQQLLAERFRLKVHRESKMVPRYLLLVGRNGPKFGPHFHAADAPAAGSSPGKREELKGYTMARLAFFLSDNRDWWDRDAADGANPPPVLDQTGLAGAYDIMLNWTSRRDWLAVFEQDTGLKLELRRVSAEMVVVDRASKAAVN
jgi:uncharacterized protein (TIGR03435 family)